MGDYIAGPNHTLPTGGAARFKGPLSVMDFVRWSSVTRLARADMERLGPVACTLAEAEGLHGHTASIRLRLERNGEAPGGRTADKQAPPAGGPGGVPPK
jgi:histidinol dehydrogenase